MKQKTHIEQQDPMKYFGIQCKMMTFTLMKKKEKKHDKKPQ